ncbi:hypothetical protein HOLleu_37786 [Holothuria leucospilota]|uniref:Uncharacterized protein n=1 Tax=Holothuria leucospilota TaxID=206669 RepID=A0A9Q0YHN2_HOLLE|nr:hypothetical protein HOLleu_37786 [Holothuria leucospilota]
MKTKEIIMDSCKNKASENAPIVMHGSVVEQVTEYNYLGTRITSNLDWSSNTIAARKKKLINKNYTKIEHVLRSKHHERYNAPIKQPL